MRNTHEAPTDNETIGYPEAIDSADSLLSAWSPSLLADSLYQLTMHVS